MYSLGVVIGFEDTAQLRETLLRNIETVNNGDAFRYRNPFPAEFRKLCVLINQSAGQPLLEAETEYNRHIDIYKSMDVRNSFELASLISRYFPGTEGTRVLTFRIDALQSQMPEDIIRELTRDLDDSFVIQVMESHTSDYVSLEQICSEMGSMTSRTFTRTEIKSILDDLPTIVSKHDLYRLIQIDKNTLLSLMESASDNMPLQIAYVQQVYQEVLVEARATGINNPDELNQLLESFFPESMSSIIGTIKVSFFKRKRTGEKPEKRDFFSRQKSTENNRTGIEHPNVPKQPFALNGHSSAMCPESTGPNVLPDDVLPQAMDGPLPDALYIQTPDEQTIETESPDSVEDGNSTELNDTVGDELVQTIVDTMSGNGYMSISSIQRNLSNAGISVSPEAITRALETLSDTDRLFSHGRAHRLHKQIDMTHMGSIFDRYVNCVYSAFQIFSENEEELRGCDITGWDELLQVLRCSQSFAVVEGTMPLISFDGTTVDDMVLEVVRDNPEWDQNKVLQHLYHSFGIPTRVTKASITGLGISFDYTVAEPEGDSKDIAIAGPFDEYTSSILVNGLNKDFYTVEEFKMEADSLAPDSGVNSLDDSALKQLGFVRKNKSVFRNTFPSAKAAYRSTIGNAVITLNDYEIENPTINTVISESVKAYELVQFDKNSYIPVSKLESQGISKRDLFSFPRDVKVQMNGRTFTIHYLRRKRLCGPLGKTGIDDALLEYVLISSGIFYKDRIGDVTAFNSVDRPILRDMIEDLVHEAGDLDIDDIQYDLKEVYGVDRSPKSIKRSINDSNMIYIEDIDKVFWNKETMRRFANGESDGLS